MKKKIVFIGSFKESVKRGGVGGQMFACRSMIESTLIEHFDFHLIDSTAISIPAPSVFRRMGSVFARQFRFLKLLSMYRIDIVIAFSSSGLSFIEKGSMLVFAKLLGKKTVLAPDLD